MTDQAVTETQLPAYEKLKRPLGRLLAWSSPLLILIPAALYFGGYREQIETLTRHSAIETIAFFANTYIFAVFWLVYFASGWASPSKHQSLRTLLMTHTQQWSVKEDQHKVELLRAKATTTMTTHAIFIAIAVLIISALARDSYVIGGGQIRLIDHWVAIASLAAAMGSFTLLLVSTDAAETMFNSFVQVREELAVSRLYKISARLKYHGFVLCFISLALYAFTMHATVASMGIVLFLFVGYTYWFPSVAVDQTRFKEELRLFQGLLIGVNAYIGLHAFF